MISKQVMLLKLQELPKDAMIEAEYQGKRRILTVAEVMGMMVGAAKRTSTQRAFSRAGVHLRWLRKAIAAGDVLAIQRHQRICDKLISPEWTQEMLAKAPPAESEMTAEEAAELESELADIAAGGAAQKRERKLG